MNICKKIAVVVILLLMGISSVSAQKNQSYNFQRALEALTEKDDESEGVEYLKKELQDNPKNGCAWYWMACVYYNHDDYGTALSQINNSIKYLPNSEKAYRASAHQLRCKIYLYLEDTVKALSDVNVAIKINPKNEDLYGLRAGINLGKGELKSAEKDCREMLKLNEGSAAAYVLLGREDLRRGDKNAAISKFTQAINLHSDYQPAYTWRGLVYGDIGQYDAAINDHINALRISYSSLDYWMLQFRSENNFDYTISKLRKAATDDKTTGLWYYIIGQLYDDKGLFAEAIESYLKAYDVENNGLFLSCVASCYSSLGNYSCALKYIDDAIEDDDTDVMLYVKRAIIYDYMGETSRALSDMDKALSLPEDENRYFVYHKRGWIKEHNGDTRGAMKDYNKSISINPKYSYNYLCRGKINVDMGYSEEATADFNKVVALETDSTDYSALPYAYYYLGQASKAKKTLTIMLRHGGSLYDAACLYSLLNESTQALSYFEKALQNGYRNFSHIERDSDLDNIRGLSRFKNLVEKYKAMPMQMDCNLQGTGTIEKVVEIPYTKYGGVYKVQCNINGCSMDMIFDSGASDVSISSSEANYMLKQGYLTENDIRGKKNYRDANGDIHVGTTINLRKITIGDISIENVAATVVHNDNAPVLLGQSAISKLGKYEFDYGRRIIKITTRVSADDSSDKDALSTVANAGKEELLSVLNWAQNDSRRTSRFKSYRDELMYETLDKIRAIQFYKDWYRNGADCASDSIQNTRRLFIQAISILDKYDDAIIDNFDFNVILQ